MNHLRIEIDCDNAAFGEDGTTDPSELRTELSCILQGLAKRVSWDSTEVWKLHDTNGNQVGSAEWV